MSRSITSPALTEAAIMRGLMDALAAVGFDLRYHTRYSLGSRDGIGFPDIVALRLSRDAPVAHMVAIETKGPNGRIGPGQRDWIDIFGAVRGCVMAEIVGPTDKPGQWISYDAALRMIGDLR